MVKICVFGAGAIGGYLATSLAQAGADVSIVARGAHLAAIKASGLRLQKDGAETTHRIKATDDPGELGEQDYVIVSGMKAHAVPACGFDRFAPCYGPKTCTRSLRYNGITLLYIHGAGTGTELDETLVVERRSTGRRANGRPLAPGRATVCVVYPPATVTATRASSTHKTRAGDRFTLCERLRIRKLKVRILRTEDRRGLKAPAQGAARATRSG
jgi:2-dehydropantoate 2-reductase